jgi:hypothetical protein
MLRLVRSGGQTGVDRAALDAAALTNIPIAGWCPKGRRAEDGMIPSKYPLQETPTRTYIQRTQWNVRDADGTLVLTWGPARGGTKRTIDHARKLKKALLVFDLEESVTIESCVGWVVANRIRTLNVAGPRESFRPGIIYAQAFQLLKKIFEASSPRSASEK